MHHDFIGAFQNLVHAQIPQEPLNRVVLQVAVPTVHLQAVVCNVPTLVGGELLRHGAVHRVVGCLLGDEAGALPNH